MAKSLPWTDEYVDKLEQAVTEADKRIQELEREMDHQAETVRVCLNHIDVLERENKELRERIERFRGYTAGAGII
jgi:chromosome segregation ATPase